MVKSKITISVIIATKNREKDLLLCLKSMEDQTLLSKETIIIDASDEKGLNQKIKKIQKTKYKIYSQ